MKEVDLQSASREELSHLARKLGVKGWHELRKSDLIREVRKRSTPKTTAKPVTARSSSTKPPAKSNPPVAAASRSTRSPKISAAKPAVSRKPVDSKSNASSKATTSGSAHSPARKGQTSQKSSTASGGGKVRKSFRGELPAIRSRNLAQTDNELKERFVVLVRDPYWLQAVWELRRDTIRRAETALGADWHRSVPVLRLLDVSGREHSAAGEVLLKELEIHGGCNTWFIPLDGQPRSYRLVLGYRTTTGKLQILARSNVVTPPRPGSPGALSGMWDDLEAEYQQILTYSGAYSEGRSQEEIRDFFETRLGHPIQSPNNSAELDHDDKPIGPGNLPLSLNLEVVLRGRTEPQARIAVHGTTVEVADDGTFQAVIRLEDGRTLIPTVVTRRDGSAQRTVVLSVERNSRELDRPSTGE